MGGNRRGRRCVEEIRRFEGNASGARRVEKRLLLLGGDETVGPAPMFGIGPTMDPADVDTNHLGYHRDAPALFDDSLCWIHDLRRLR